MNPRMKKLIGMVVLAPALVLYFGAAVTLADRLPPHPLAKLAYFVVAGLVWAAPVIPIIRWMERAPAEKKRSAP